MIKILEFLIAIFEQSNIALLELLSHLVDVIKTQNVDFAVFFGLSGKSTLKTTLILIPLIKTDAKLFS